jgi:hypothetical protein
MELYEVKKVRAHQRPGYRAGHEFPSPFSGLAALPNGQDDGRADDESSEASG